MYSVGSGGDVLWWYLNGVCGCDVVWMVKVIFDGDVWFWCY